MMRAREATLSRVTDVCTRTFDPEAAEPELRLMLAVLEDAVVTLQRGRDPRYPLQRRHLLEIGRWIESGDVESLYSFENVCTALHLDPAYVRAGLEAMTRGSSVIAAPRRRVRRGWSDSAAASRSAALRAGRRANEVTEQ